MLGSKLGTLFGSAARRTGSAARYSGSPSIFAASPPPPPTSSPPPSSDKVKKDSAPKPQAPKRPPQGQKPQGQPRPAAGATAAKAAPQSAAPQTTGDQKKPETWSSLLGDLKKANATGQQQQQRRPRDQQAARQPGQGENRPRQESSQGGAQASRAPGQQQQGSSGERRVYNNRAPQNRGPPRRGAPGVSKPAVSAASAGAASVASAGVAAAALGGAMPPARLFGNKRDADEDEDESRETDEIPPEIEPYLFDSPFFEEVTKKGQSMDYSDMDPADKFFADVWMESFKSSSHEVTYVMEKEDINRVRIPKPRATVDLLQTLIPDIHSVDQRKDKEAMEVASEAWQALSKNVYFADDDKSYMCNQIAKQAKYFFDESEKLSKSGAADAFLIFNPDFRRGWEGMDAEAQRQLFADFESSGSSAEAAVLGEDGEDVTDYSKAAEAVVDEDQL